MHSLYANIFVKLCHTIKIERDVSFIMRQRGMEVRNQTDVLVIFVFPTTSYHSRMVAPAKA